MQDTIALQLPTIRALMHRYGVEKAYVFGSAAKGTMTKDSDVDFVIRFPKDMHYSTYADNYFALADALEELLDRRMELITEKTIKNPYLQQSINQNKVAIL